MALPLALLLAMLLEALLLAIGLAMGDGSGDRGGLAASLRHVAIFASMLFVPCLWAGTHIGPTLIARYDGEVMKSPPARETGSQSTGPRDAPQRRAWTALESWCQAGAGDGRSPFWRPWGLPDVPERFSLAVMVGGDRADRSRLAQAFALHLDRNDELAALSADSRLKGLHLKLAVKWHELWWWRKRHPRQPWDCGYLTENAAAMARLAHFRPRRPTLIIADPLRDSSLEQALQALNGAASDYRHPVRLLVLDAAVPSMLKLRLDADAQRWYTPVCSSGPVSVIDFTGRHFQDQALQPLAEDHA